MQEISSAFLRAHAQLAQLMAALSITACISVVLWLITSRKTVFLAQNYKIAPLPLSSSDLLVLAALIALLTCFGAYVYIMLIAGVMVLWKLHTHSFFTYVKTSTINLPLTLLISFLIALSLFLPLQLLSEGVQNILQSFGFKVAVEPAVQLFLRAKNVSQLWSLIPLATLGAPLVEEFVFRGVIYPALKQWLPPWGAMICAGLVFGLFHVHLASLLPLTLLGTILCLTFDKTGSLWMGIFIHAWFNAFAVAFLVIAKFYSGAPTP